jgi:hypothetical protein
MSYLNTLRLHFAGQFQCNVSTVNNDPGHYDNAIFQPSYQTLQGPNFNPPNGWFNPQGDAAFRLLGCTVTGAWTPAGAVPSSDPVTGYIVADADDRVPAKMVDLDPEQQLVSEIWGLEVRIADQAGNTMMRGQFEPAAFLDIWDRATGSSGGDTIAGAMYQSVLTGLVWGDVSASPFLTKLKSAAKASGMLSIKLNVDGMNLQFTDPNFMCGRITGTIGPAAADEPHHLVIGRQFMAAASSNPNVNFFAPAGGINFFPAVVDMAASCVLLDLGNALTTSTPGGPVNDIGDLTLQAYDPLTTPGNPVGTMTPLGTIPAQGANGYAGNASWYNQTAGIVSLPLTADQLKLVEVSPLALSGNTDIAITEWPNAAFVRADRFVYRMSPGDAVKIPVYATQFGRPLAGASIAFTFDPGQLQGQNASIFVAPPPPVAVPATALQFNATATTDQNGIALLAVSGTDPGSPRLFDKSAYGIDGQVYGIRPAFADSAMNTGPIDQWNFVSFLLWSSFKPGNPVTWSDLQPVFEQYANLYPVMVRFLNLADYNQVNANADLLSLAFGLDISDPNSMPVTRDLSPAKRQAILAWLQNPLPGPVALRAARVAAVRAAPSGPVLPPGGKAAAAARRLILQKH